MYKETEPLIENTVCEARIGKDGKVISYRIKAAEGYLLHETTLDEKIIDENTGQETGEIKKGFTASYITAGAGYDFVKNPREIYCVNLCE